MKVARGRLWQPEIGMEHASRGRRSGNKGVGARWRGRFRIFSARHCSRTKVSHAENSGMTTVFFLWGLLRCRGVWEREHEGGLIRCAGRQQEWSFGAVPPQERWHEGGWFLFFLWRLLRCRGGILSHPQERTARGVFGLGGFFHMLRRDGTRIAFCFCDLWEVLCVSLRAVAGAGMRSRASRDAFPSGAWERHRGGGALLLFVLRVVAGACVGRGTGQARMPPRERQHEGF